MLTLKYREPSVKKLQKEYQTKEMQNKVIHSSVNIYKIVADMQSSIEWNIKSLHCI